MGENLNVAGMTDYEHSRLTETQVARRTTMKNADVRAIVIKVLGGYRIVDNTQLETLWIILLILTVIGATGHQTATHQNDSHRSPSPGHMRFQSPSHVPQRQGNYR